MVNPIVAVSLEFRLESARSRLYKESLRESRLLPISDRSRDLAIVQMKSDSAIIFSAHFRHFRGSTNRSCGPGLLLSRDYRSLVTTTRSNRALSEIMSVSFLQPPAREYHRVSR
jgi:hypothetical protein